MKKMVSALLACVICLGTAVSSFAASEPEWVVKPTYDKINRYSGGLTTAKKGGTWYILNSKGGVVKKLPYNAAYLKKYSSGAFIDDTTGNNTEINIQGFYGGLAEVTEVSKQGAAYMQNGTLGFINTSGKMVLDFSGPRAGGTKNETPLGIQCGGFTDNGLTWSAPATTMAWNESTVTYIDKKGKVKFKSPNDTIATLKSFSEGLAAQITVDGVLRYINTAGEVVFSLPGYKDGGDFKNGYVWVTRADGKEGIVNKSGQFIIQPKYAAVGDVSPEGLMYFKDANGLCGFMDLNGNVTVPAKFKALYSPREGVAYASEDGKTYGVINVNGEYLIAPQFAFISLSYDGLICVQALNGEWGVIKNPLVSAKK